MIWDIVFELVLRSVSLYSLCFHFVRVVCGFNLHFRLVPNNFKSAELINQLKNLGRVSFRFCLKCCTYFQMEVSVVAFLKPQCEFWSQRTLPVVLHENKSLLSQETVDNLRNSVFRYILKRLKTHLLTWFTQSLILSKCCVEQSYRNMHRLCIFE